jgi:Zn-dependent protease
VNPRQGFQIGTVRGIPIRIHFSFLLILPFLAYLFSQSFVEAARLAGVPPAQLSGAPWMWGLLVALALFASVLLHELAHSLYALAHGGKVRSITLLMIGGISELTEAPRRPAEEAWMALAGPATSLLAGGAFYLLLVVTRGRVGFDVRFALYYLAQLNVVLGLFNLLPAFPLDGGRILRALLSRRHGPVRATQVAVAVGKAIAVLLGLAGLASGNFLLAIIAFFVFVGAQAEQHAVLVRAILGELRVRELMSSEPVSVAPEDDLFGIGERMLREAALLPGRRGRERPGHRHRPRRRARPAGSPRRHPGQGGHDAGLDRLPGRPCGRRAAHLRRPARGAPAGGGGGPARRGGLGERRDARPPLAGAGGVPAPGTGPGRGRDDGIRGNGTRGPDGGREVSLRGRGRRMPGRTRPGRPSRHGRRPCSAGRSPRGRQP